MTLRRAAAMVVFTAAALLPLACSPSIRSYRLSRPGNTPLLIPPQINAPLSASLSVKIPNARRAPFSTAGCDINRDPISLQWRGRTAYLRAKSDSELLGFEQSVKDQPVPLDPRGSIAGPPLALDPLRYINAFRGDLFALEANGCLHGGESQALAAQIAEKLPFPPFISYLLRFGVFDLNLFLDLTPDFRLRVVYPVYQPDSQSHTKEIRGVTTVYYEVTSNRHDGRVRISETADKTSEQNGESAKKIPSPFSSSFGYSRFFLRKNTSANDPVTVAIVLSSSDRTQLEEATRELDSSAEPSCRSITLSNASCVMFPPLTGVNAEIRVKVNGKDAYPELGAQVDQLIHETGEDRPLSVQVKRLFNKRLTPINVDSGEKDILGLILMPGDVITYR